MKTKEYTGQVREKVVEFKAELGCKNISQALNISRGNSKRHLVRGYNRLDTGAEGSPSNRTTTLNIQPELQ